jgi:hypothetical protein
MEVHAHSHTARKKWTHYLWEFLMLFLAVFCGFLAEYQLEHTIEKQKGADYIKSMIEDLQNDTAKLNKVTGSLSKINNSIDTIILYYNDIGTSTNPVLLRNLRAINGFPTFFYSDRTIQQLKNSGGMRLIKDKKAADGIMDYDAVIRNYENNAIYVQRYWEGLTALRLNIIDRQSLDNLISNSADSKVKPGYLITNDPIALRKLKNLIYELQFYHKNTIRDNTGLIEKATELMEVLRTQYHL